MARKDDAERAVGAALDLVDSVAAENTAARLQSAAAPGTVWVDETTREAMEIFAALGARLFLARAEALLPVKERGGHVVVGSRGSP